MIAFAYYRLPYLHHATYVAQHEGEPEVLSSVAELNGKEGFVIAPFAPSGKCPVVLMHPDESKLVSTEGAENASLIPVNHCENYIVGVPDQPIGSLVAAAVQKVKALCAGEGC